ncbi:MAG: hypothetical protein J6J83_04905 [Oscillospiraceae bacterium]|nr:hypothetical protein [Oscillospiraceae bacterium]
MKKLPAMLAGILFLIMTLSGCGAVGDKSGSLTALYGVTAALATVLLVGYCVLVRKKEMWVLFLFFCVTVVNVSYLLLAMSTALEMALMANRIAYLGSVFLPLTMLMIILRATKTAYPKWLVWLLSAVSGVVLFVAASPGYLDIYYKDVTFAVVNGVGTLEKVYGPWHSLYLFYLLGYFVAMIAVIFRAHAKKQVESATHAVILLMAVLVNICVWLIEQLVRIDFEMLSVSYIITELFLLGVNTVMAENARLKAQLGAVSAEQPAADGAVDEAKLTAFTEGLEELTPTEQMIYELYIAHTATKDVLLALNIKENTLKYHNKNLYSKLGVSSRKELWEVYKQLRSRETT